MPTYTVYASNTIYLKTDIEADSWEQADEIQKDFIVDDFEDSCQLMSEILSVEFECSYTCQSEKALELIQEFKPDIILMDYKMPHVNGIELCKIIKKAPVLKSIPIIFISGAVTSDERIETLEAGGDDFLSKPFHPRELMLRVKKRLTTYGDQVTWLTFANARMNLKSRQCFIGDSEIAFLKNKLLEKEKENEFLLVQLYQIQQELDKPSDSEESAKNEVLTLRKTIEELQKSFVLAIAATDGDKAWQKRLIEKKDQIKKKLGAQK